MDLIMTEDQAAILAALDVLTRGYAEPALHDAPLAATHAGLDRDLREGGFLDVAADPDLGTQAAAIVVERIARLPWASEIGASAFMRPLFATPPTGPLVLLDGMRTQRALRFLAPGATVIVLEDDAVTSFVASADQIRAEPEALYAYPMATLLGLPEDRAALDVSPADLRSRWQAALAAEAAGLLAAALDSTVRYVSEREQFGRKLATFQAIRHRLAEAQVRSNGVYWLAMKAAATLDSADAAMACWYAQESARLSVYDFHQFLGGMGMTLEHPLHLWTYRLKALIGELGGRGANALAAADALWPQQDHIGHPM
ncbi:MAG: acyl-CoA dehydrogenase family protein [Blastomonas sp.]